MISEVRRIAKEYPNAVYSMDNLVFCCYTKGKCGPGFGCLLGQAMQSAGLRHIANQADEQGEKAISELFNVLNIHNANDRMWLSDVQGQQDRGATWEEAVKFADSQIGG